MPRKKTEDLLPLADELVTAQDTTEQDTPAQDTTAQDTTAPETTAIDDIDLNELLSGDVGEQDGGDLYESAEDILKLSDDDPADDETPDASGESVSDDSGDAVQQNEIPQEDESPPPDVTPAKPARRKKSDLVAPIESAPAAPRPHRPRKAPILTVESRDEVETQQSKEDTIWHEIQNAQRTRRILTGTLDGVEQTEAGKTIIIVDYKGFRVIIPVKEMMLLTGRNPTGQDYADLMTRQNKILGTMLGAEIDFIVKGIENKSRSVVASRKEAMLKKRQLFYLNTDAAGMYRIYEDRIVQARVIAVAEKVVRIEAFGVECPIMARDLSWEWLGDAKERFSVGDRILVRILSVKRNGLEDISITADAKSVAARDNSENLKKCRVQSKYAGKVTDVRKGVVYIRLNNGVNAIAHACYDRRMPGKTDEVSFAVTKIDEERGAAVGIITRIIKQNL